MRLVPAERVPDFAVVDGLGRYVGGERQRAADEIRHPLADQRADDLLRERRIAELVEERIHRRRELVHGVEQRAVEIERDRADVDDRGARRRCRAPPRHRTVASSARIASIVAR